MTTAGLDIGSRTVKLLLIQGGEVAHTRTRESTFDPLAVCRELLEGVRYDVITATGYGRHLFRNHFDCQIVSEIKAHALGARALFPWCRAVLDIGGQDTKAICLDADGRVRKFEMNDRCAAGTGRFLEVMAMALGYALSDFGSAALSARRAEKLNSMCTVFAESEIVSLLAQGAERAEVALGIHQAVVSRSFAMLARVSAEEDVVFVGGVALNPCMRELLGAAIGKAVHTPEDPQTVGALGCALCGLRGD